MADPQQGLINWLIGLFAGLLTAAYSWIFTRLHKKMDDLEIRVDKFVPRQELNDTFATRNELMAAQLSMSEMASRKELIAHMDHLAAEKQRMHQENLRRMDDVREDLLQNRLVIAESNKETNTNFREINKRIDALRDNK